jgi:hypothetical protein
MGFNVFFFVVWNMIVHKVFLYHYGKLMGKSPGLATVVFRSGTPCVQVGNS